MAEQIIGYVSNIKGKYYAKNESGQMHQIKAGDPIKKGETVVGDAVNAKNSKLEISVESQNEQKDVLIVTQRPLLIDDTVLKTALVSTSDGIVSPSVLKQTLGAGEITQSNTLGINALQARNDVGLNRQSDERNESDRFSGRTGDATNVNSSLRNAKFHTKDINYDFQPNTESIVRDLNFEKAIARDPFKTPNGLVTEVGSDLRDSKFPVYLVDLEGRPFDVPLADTNVNANIPTFFAQNYTNIPANFYSGQQESSSVQSQTETTKTEPQTQQGNTYVNSTPTAVNDATALATEGGPVLNGNVLTNDIPGGDGLISGKELKEFTYNGTTYTFDTTHTSYTVASPLGTLKVNINGTWELTPGGITQNTIDKFTYKIVDSNGDISNSATQPIVMLDGGGGGAITSSTAEDTSVTIVLGDRGTISINGSSLAVGAYKNIIDGANVVGKVGNNGDGTITFYPSGHYSGTTPSFTYDATLSTNVTISGNVSVTVGQTAEVRVSGSTTDTNANGTADIVTQGDKYYDAGIEQPAYGWISLSGLSVTNEDDHGVSAAINPFGSETTTVKLSGVPAGYKFQYNDGTTTHDLTVTNVNTGVTIPFEYISTLKVKPTNYDSGDIIIKMEVIAVDGASTKTSNPDFLTLHIEPKAWNVTVSTQQATGNEDAGRSHGNTHNDTSATTVDQPQNGVSLSVNIANQDTSGKDKFTVMISGIPDGGIIYYSDSNGTVTINESGIISGSNANVSATNTAGSSWKLTIANFDNNAPLKFVPPHNSNTDYTFVVDAFAKDGNSISGNSSGLMNTVIDIKGIADIPINDTFKKVDYTGNVNADTNKNIYSAVAVEDTSNTTNGVSINFKDLYKQAGLNSYDNADGSEQLSIVISNLSSDFDVSGTGVSFNGAVGTAREWSFNVSQINNVVITSSKNFSGETTFNVKHTTTENDGNSKAFSSDIKILVTPLVEATIATSSTATEDQVTAVNLNIVQQNGETNETMDAVWIKKSDVTGKNFTLYTDAGGTTALAANGTTITDDGTYYKLTGAAIASVYIKYDAQIGSSNTSDNSFAIKYTATDSVAVTGQTLTSTKTEVSGVYNITLQSVSDPISVDTSNVTGANITNNGIVAGVKTITINNTGAFTLDVDVSNLADTDGSEKATRLVIDGVQRGITVSNATMGISGGKNIWFLDVPDTALGATGAKFTVTFNVNNTIIPDEDSVIKITAYSQDTGALSTDTKTANTSIKFIDGMISGGGTTSDIDAVMSVNNTLITEDTAFKLSSVLTVTADTVNDPTETGTYSIAFKSLNKVAFDTSLSTHTINNYNDGSGEIYVITVTGGQTAINNMLNSVYLKPVQDYNKNNAAGNNLTFEAVLTAYQSTGYGRDTATVNFTSADDALSVKPVTDTISSTQVITYVDASNAATANAKEDGTYTIKINLSTVDAPDYTLVQGAANLAAAATIAITRTAGAYGTLSWGGGSYTFDATHSTADVPVARINDGTLKFTPAANVAGSVTFSYTIYANETGADNISSTSKSFTITIEAIADGLQLPELKGIGNEDTYIQIYSDYTNTTPLSGAIMKDTDGSESITAMFIDKVPENFLIYVGESGSQTLATKGLVDTTQVDLGDGNGLVNTYKWSIDISNGVPKVWLKAPAQWSSATAVDLTLITTVKDTGSYTTDSANFQVTINPVADGFSSVAPTNSFQTASSDTLIRLSANAIDMDGSETGVLTLKGLGAGAAFKQDGASMAANTTYNAGTDTYTITNIDLATSKLNKLTLEQQGLTNQNVDFTFKTVEAVGGASSAVVTNSLQITTDTLHTYTNGTNVAGGTDGDRLLLDNGVNIDFTVLADTITSIEKIDLTKNGNHSLDNISLAAISGLTDSNKDLIISGDAGDTVTFKSGDNWSKAAGAGSDAGFSLYTNSVDATVLVKVDDHITNSIA